MILLCVLLWMLLLRAVTELRTEIINENFKPVGTHCLRCQLPASFVETADKHSAALRVVVKDTGQAVRPVRLRSLVGG